MPAVNQRALHTIVTSNTGLLQQQCHGILLAGIKEVVMKIPKVTSLSGACGDPLCTSTCTVGHQSRRRAAGLSLSVYQSA